MVEALVPLGVGVGLDGLGALVEHVDMRRANPRRVQAKPSQETEAIQHLRPGGELRHGLVIGLLIQI